MQFLRFILLAILIGCAGKPVDDTKETEKKVSLTTTEARTLEIQVASTDMVTAYADGEYFGSWTVSAENPVLLQLTIAHETGWTERVDATIEHNSPNRWVAVHGYVDQGNGPIPNSFTVESTTPEDTPTEEGFELTISSSIYFQLDLIEELYKPNDGAAILESLDEYECD